jgi:hypothetical protein
MNLRWSVLWRTGESIISHSCGNDLDEAIRVFTMAKKAGKTSATLRCDNAGLPPPEKYQRREWRIVNPDAPKKDQKNVRVLVLMERANNKGIFWCPYCREFRRFGRQLYYYVEGRFARHPNKRGMLACPMCGISHRDFHVRKWNPVAAMFFQRETRRKRAQS